jgi:hypothetical protein
MSCELWTKLLVVQLRKAPTATRHKLADERNDFDDGDDGERAEEHFILGGIGLLHIAQRPAGLDMIIERELCL